MTQDEIIRIAEKACAPHQILNTDLVFLERFAVLVAEPWIETNKALAKEVIEHRNNYLDRLAEAIDVSVKAEREACAKVCETDDLCCKCGDECAAAIRNRGETK